MSLDFMQKVSITKPESRITMPDTFDFVMTEYPGLFGPVRNTPGEKTFLPSQQQTNGPGVDNAVKKTGHSYYKGYICPESFGSYQDVMDALRKPVSSYSLLYEHPKVHKPIWGLNTNSLPFEHPEVHKPAPGLKRKLESMKDDKAIVKATPKCKPVSKKNVGEYDRFPKNVKSLLKTGMFDGVPVLYVSKTEGEVIRGTIKGNVYRCGCGSCKYEKTISASEFERHALGGNKTSHSNNHIRFENKKTMHAVVKELQNTPANMLFDVLQSVTGSPINQEAFCAWKESYLADMSSRQEWESRIVPYPGCCD